MKREGSPLRGVSTIALKEAADHMTSARMHLIMLLVLLTAIGSVFLGDAPRSGAFFTAFLVFLAAVVFLRAYTLAAAFLRFALVFPEAFFRVAITSPQVSFWIPVAESLPKEASQRAMRSTITKADIGESGPDPFSRKLSIDLCRRLLEWAQLGPGLLLYERAFALFERLHRVICRDGT